jgi:SHS2 domain-containing protein
MVLTRQEKEDLVLNLYNQGRTYREIAKEARMSPRDIGVILNRTAEKKEMEKAKEYQDTQNIDEQKQDNPKLSLSTQAYRLFSKGKTPIEVAIILDLVASEVSRYFK